jgi:hypothetical protein
MTMISFEAVIGLWLVHPNIIITKTVIKHKIKNDFALIKKFFISAPSINDAELCL